MSPSVPPPVRLLASRMYQNAGTYVTKIELWSNGRYSAEVFGFAGSICDYGSTAAEALDKLCARRVEFYNDAVEEARRSGLAQRAEAATRSAP